MPRLAERQTAKAKAGQPGRTVALVYARKSLVKRAGATPASPEMQADAVQARARDLNLTPELYVDAEGWRSGRDENRAAWQQLRARLDDNDIAAVIIYSWDRAVRNTKLLLALADDLEQRNIRFISVSDNIDTTSAAGRFQLTVIGGVGEFESNAASERRVQTIDYLRRSKGRHYGTTPFGAERVQRDGDLVLVPSAKPQPNGTDNQALQYLYELYARGDAGQQALTDRLNADGWRFRDRRGQLRPFGVKDVRRLLYNHWLYAGYVIIGRSYQGNFEVIPGSHAPLLPVELTQAIAARYATFRRGWRRTATPYLHPLSGVLQCAACGMRLAGVKNKLRHVYVHANMHRCAAGSRIMWLAAGIEASVRAHIAGLSFPPEFQAQDAERMRLTLAREHSGRSLSGEQARLAGAVDRLADLYSDGEITRDQYDAKKARYAEQLAQLSASDPALPPEIVAVLDVVLTVREASPADFRAITQALYSQIDVLPDGTLAYSPRDWAKTWA